MNIYSLSFLFCSAINMIRENMTEKIATEMTVTSSAIPILLTVSTCSCRKHQELM